MIALPRRTLTTLSPPTLRRSDAMTQQALKQTWGEYSTAPFPYDTSVVANHAKPLPSEKKRAPVKQKFQRVYVSFPRWRLHL